MTLEVGHLKLLKGGVRRQQNMEVGAALNGLPYFKS